MVVMPTDGTKSSVEGPYTEFVTVHIHLLLLYVISKFSQTVSKTHLVLPKITTLNIPYAHVHQMFWNIPVCDYITDYVT